MDFRHRYLSFFPNEFHPESKPFYVFFFLLEEVSVLWVGSAIVCRVWGMILILYNTVGLVYRVFDFLFVSVYRLSAEDDLNVPKALYFNFYKM